MAIETSSPATPGEHIVQFYESEDDLTRAVGSYLARAARASDAIILIATEAHRRSLEALLEERRVDVERARARRRFVCLDAAATLEVLKLDGRLRRGAFDEVIGGLVRDTVASGRPTRIYGDMVGLLSSEDRLAEALLLERWWNELLREVPFSLLCSYSTREGAGREQPELLSEICHLHTGVRHLPSAGERDEVTAPAKDDVRGRFAAEPQAAREARHLIGAALERLGYDETVAYQAALVTSELASNAIRHAATPFSVALNVRGSRLRIAIGDRRRRSAAEREEGFIARSPCGLGVVAALATRWGVEDTPMGKVVWTELLA